MKFIVIERTEPDMESSRHGFTGETRAFSVTAETAEEAARKYESHVGHRLTEPYSPTVTVILLDEVVEI